MDLGRDHFATWFLEISIITGEIDHTLSNIKCWASDVKVDTPMFLGPARSKIIYEPLGVVCIMGSWNFPLYTILAPLIHAISSGNCAVIKPSEIAPNTLLCIKSLLDGSIDNQCYICIEG